MPTAAKKILIAEDFEILSKLIRNSLRNINVEFVDAFDGAEAFEKAKALKPDLIIMDMNMPKMNGYEVTEALRRIPEFSKLPILMLTATGSEETALQAGCTAFMNKPYSPGNLRSKVLSLLGMPE
ncbi:MAG: response regulator [Bdellovibrionota bacterium]